MDFKDLKPDTFYTRVVDSGFDVFTFRNTYNNSYLVCNVAFRKNWSICSVSGIRLSTPEEQHWLEECIERDEFIPKTSIIKKEPNYIVGKWYKSTPEENRRRGHTYYGKFAELKNNKFVASECTLGKDKVDGRKHTFESYIWHLLEDLTEIQDLLPNGHPDKTKNTFTDMDIPDYIKNATFKIGQTVKLKSTGSSVSHCAYGAKTGDIVIITKINDLEGSASKKDPRYYGDNFNVRGCDLETIDEIVSKDILVQTNMSQTEACGICKFKNNCSLGPHKSLCPAQNGMHYPDNIDMTSILQECYNKYPIGTQYKCAVSPGSIKTVIKQEFKIVGNLIYTQPSYGILYDKGKYAEIIKAVSNTPAYIKCIKRWNGTTNSIVDKIYDTSIEPDFSNCTWEKLLENLEYFKPSTKEAFDKQHNPVINIAVGECFVVTQEESCFVGKQDYCYKRIESSDKNLFYISSDRAVDPECTKVRPASIKETLYYDSIKSEFNINDMTVVENLEEILKICKEKYPIGTVFKDINNSNEYKVKEELIAQYGGISHSGISFVYFHGKYADIVKLPEKNITEKIIPENETLCVGDIVVVTERYSTNIPIGTVTKILEIDDSDVPYNVEYNQTNSWCKNVRKATPDERLFYCAPIAEKVVDTTIRPQSDTDYNIGDWFFVQQNTTGGCRLTIGKVYQIQNINRNSWVEAKEYGENGGQIFLRDIRRAFHHEIPTQDSFSAPITKNKTIISDIIEVKKLKTFSK